MWIKVQTTCPSLCSNKTSSLLGSDNCFTKLTLNSIAISSFAREILSSPIAPEIFLKWQIPFSLKARVSDAPVVKEAVSSA